MYRTLRTLVGIGIVSEPPPPADETLRQRAALQDEILSVLGRALCIRHVDAGSCNGCEIEVAATFGPVYDADRYGAKLVASARHADVVLVTGVVTRNMLEPLRRTVEATPTPRVVLAVGDCARNCGVFAGGIGVAGAVHDAVDVDLSVPGCPPEPDVIVEALRRVTLR